MPCPYSREKNLEFDDTLNHDSLFTIYISKKARRGNLPMFDRVLIAHVRYVKNPNMTPRPSCHFSIFGLVFFVLKSLLGIARQWSREKFAILILKPRSQVRVLIYRRWAIVLTVHVKQGWLLVSPQVSL